MVNAQQDSQYRIEPVANPPAFASDIERWNLNAQARAEELSGNDDPSYRGLVNLVLKRISALYPPSVNILDAGCGLGYLSAAASSAGYNVVGIDPSLESINIAKVSHRNGVDTGGLVFEAKSLEQYAAVSEPEVFEVIIANMTLHAVQKLPTFLDSAARLLSSSGVIVATIPNPGTYLQSRSDIDVGDLDLRRQQLIEIPFRIHSHDPHPAFVYYYHRPFRTYTEAARSAHLYLSDYFVPEQIGIGKARDIALLEFRKWSPDE